MSQLPVVARNLDFLMKQRGLSQGALAKLTGLTQPTIWRILKGVSEVPETRTLDPLAKFFGISMEQLLKLDLKASGFIAPSGSLVAASEKPAGSTHPFGGNVQPGPDIVAYYPVLGRVPAGDFKEAVENALYDTGVRWIPYMKKLERAFFLRIAGASMSPTLVEGDLVLVDADALPIHRSIVVARNGSNEATVKRLMIDGSEKMLVPDNVQYPAKPLGDCEIVGVVIAALKEF
jgi:SOS-response transcriptional repressor LexA